VSPSRRTRAGAPLPVQPTLPGGTAPPARPAGPVRAVPSHPSDEGPLQRVPTAAALAGYRLLRQTQRRHRDPRGKGRASRTSGTPEWSASSRACRRRRCRRGSHAGSGSRCACRRVRRAQPSPVRRSWSMLRPGRAAARATGRGSWGMGRSGSSSSGSPTVCGTRAATPRLAAGTTAIARPASIGGRSRSRPPTSPVSTARQPTSASLCCSARQETRGARRAGRGGARSRGSVA
jgi:hypothetical protein